MPPEVPPEKVFLLAMFASAVLPTDASAWAARAASAGAPAARADSAGAPAARAAIAGAPAAGADSAGAPAARAAIGRPRDRAAGGVSRSASDSRKFVAEWRELVEDFLQKNHLYLFSKVYGNREYICKIEGIHQLSVKIKDGHSFAVVTLKIAYDNKREKVIIHIPIIMDSASKIEPRFNKEQFIKKIENSIR